MLFLCHRRHPTIIETFLDDMPPILSPLVLHLCWYPFMVSCLLFFHDSFISNTNSGCYTNLTDVDGVIIQVVHDGLLISLMLHQVSLF